MRRIVAARKDSTTRHSSIASVPTITVHYPEWVPGFGPVVFPHLFFRCLSSVMHTGVLINPLRLAVLRRGWVCSRCQFKKKKKKDCKRSNLRASVFHIDHPVVVSSLLQNNSVCRLPCNFRKERAVPLSGVPSIFSHRVFGRPAVRRSLWRHSGFGLRALLYGACRVFFELFSPDILITLSTTSISDKLVGGRDQVPSVRLQWCSNTRRFGT